MNICYVLEWLCPIQRVLQDRSHGSGYLSEHGAGLGGGVSGGVVVQGVVLQIWVPDDPTGTLWS